MKPVTVAGVDLVVNNAGLSISKPLADTTVADWDILHDVMARGSFLVSREAAKAMEAQGMGGDIVYIVSKNGVFAGSASLSATTTQAPSAASRFAVARPMPEPAPVTSAIRPASGLGLGRRRSLASSSSQYSMRNFSLSGIGA